jgi:hypothetical protein
VSDPNYGLKMPRRPALPKDPSQRAKALLDCATGTAPAKVPFSAAQEFARLGGLKGGKARAEKLSSEERIAIAKKAAQTRWEK